MPDFILGLDLGQTSDPTALCVLRRTLLRDAEGSSVRNLERGLLHSFVCVHLERYPLGKSYPAIVAAVKALIERPALGKTSHLAVDATGVGRPVVDLFADACPASRLWPITITAGAEFSAQPWNRSDLMGFHVPKLELASTVQAGLASGRLKFASLRDAPLLEVMKRELLSFQVKTTKAGNETFSARSGAHDDLVLALAVAMWLGELPRISPNAQDDSISRRVGTTAPAETVATLIGR